MPGNRATARDAPFASLCVELVGHVEDLTLVERDAGVEIGGWRDGAENESETCELGTARHAVAAQHEHVMLRERGAQELLLVGRSARRIPSPHLGAERQQWFELHGVPLHPPTGARPSR